MLERDQQAWDAFVFDAHGGSFLQSWEWGELQKETNAKYWRLSDEVSQALVIKRNLPKKCWLYVPRGPLLGTSLINKDAGSTNDFLNAMSESTIMKSLMDIAEKEQAIFIRIEPSENLGRPWRKSSRDMQPRDSIIVDLENNEEKMLSKMSQKTRYNVRLAEKKGVRVRWTQEKKDLDYFLKLIDDVQERGEFRYHPADYYRAMQKSLSPTSFFELGIAEHEGDVLAVHVLVSFGKTVTYVHGASASIKRSLMAPHLLQWESIKRAKQQGFQQYDFFGVAPKDGGPSHPWAGITRFKEGFGGTRKNYPGSYDLVLSYPWYFMYSIAHRLKK